MISLNQSIPKQWARNKEGLNSVRKANNKNS